MVDRDDRPFGFQEMAEADAFRNHFRSNSVNNSLLSFSR
jgi:hypothetical protein